MYVLGENGADALPRKLDFSCVAFSLNFKGFQIFDGKIDRGAESLFYESVFYCAYLAQFVTEQGRFSSFLGNCQKSEAYQIDVLSVSLNFFAAAAIPVKDRFVAEQPPEKMV